MKRFKKQNTTQDVAEYSNDDEYESAENHGWINAFIIAGAIGLLFILIFSYGSGELGSDAKFDLGMFLRSLSVATLLAGSSLIIGGLIGLLFGIPRSLQGEGGANIDPQTPTAENDETAKERYAANTNLERLSDWLTGIIVGVSLTQVERISDFVEARAAQFGEVIGGQGGEEIALSIMVYYTGTGLIFGFLWTRMYLPRLFTLADLAARARKVKVGERQVKQVQFDVRCLHLAERYLGEELEPQDFTVDDLRSSIRKASRNARTLLFYKAQQARNTHLRVRSVPILDELVKLDTDENFYSNRTQLAYALKDNPQATEKDLQRAIDLLTKAISLRKQKGISRSIVERFNLAVCRIRTDPEFKNGEASTHQAQALIYSDLDADIEKRLTDVNVDQWRRLNPRNE